jgi:hypothetical protein
MNSIIASIRHEDSEEHDLSARGVRLYKGPAESRSRQARSIVTMVRPAASVPIENLVWLVAAYTGPK